MQFYDNNFEVGEGSKGWFDGILQRRRKIGFIKKMAPLLQKSIYATEAGKYILVSFDILICHEILTLNMFYIGKY